VRIQGAKQGGAGTAFIELRSLDGCMHEFDLDHSSMVSGSAGHKWRFRLMLSCFQ